MSPSTAPPSCSLTRTARMVPLTRPQTVTSCAMTLPSTCAPSPIRRSEARNSPLMRPKTCAGPLHSMLPTIDIPEPMQERVAAFAVGSRLGGGCSTTDCCCCTVLPTTSAASTATSLSFSGALLLNIPTSVCRRHLLGKGQASLPPFGRELPLTLYSPEGRTLRLGPHLRIGLRKTELPPRGRRRLSAILCTEHPPRFTHRHRCVQLCFVKKNWDNCGAARRELLKNSSSVVFRSQNCRQRAAPENGPHEMEAPPENPDDAQRDKESPGRAGAFDTFCTVPVIASSAPM